MTRYSKGHSGYDLWRKLWDIKEGQRSHMNRSEGLLKNFRWPVIWFVFRKFNPSSVGRGSNRSRKDMRQVIKGAINCNGLGNRKIKVGSSSEKQKDRKDGYSTAAATGIICPMGPSSLSGQIRVLLFSPPFPSLSFSYFHKVEMLTFYERIFSNYW